MTLLFESYAPPVQIGSACHRRQLLDGVHIDDCPSQVCTLYKGIYRSDPQAATLDSISPLRIDNGLVERRATESKVKRQNGKGLGMRLGLPRVHP